MEKIETIICHWEDKRITDIAIYSLHRFYPRLSVRIINDPLITDHGSRLDKGFRESKSEFILTLDNDMFVVGEKIIEKLYDEIIKDKKIYGVGLYMTTTNNRRFYGFIHPMFALYRRKIVVNENVSFKAIAKPNKIRGLNEFATGEKLGYGLGKKGYKGIHFNINPYLVHLSELKGWGPYG